MADKKVSLLNDLDIENKKIRRLNVSLSESLELVRQASLTKSALEDELRKTQRNVYRLKELIIICNGLPKEVAILRKKIVKKMVRARRKDITVDDKENLDHEIATLTLELQKACTHNFVIVLSDNYSGTQSYDFEDARPGFRRCIVCGFEEGSMSHREDLYEVLFSSDARLVKRDLRSCGKRDGNYNSDEIWENLDIFLVMFESSAGEWNLKFNLELKTPVA